jgi:hypothetical protein
LIAVLVAARELGDRPKQFVDSLDLSKYLPAGLGENPGVALAAFSLLIVILLSVGLRGSNPPATDGDLAKRGEVSDGLGS